MAVTRTIAKGVSLREAIAKARRGDVIVYHIGDICRGPHRGAARNLHLEGRVLLTQRRLGEGRFAYQATKI